MSLKSKVDLRKQSSKALRDDTVKESWIALNRYFNGGANGPEAKVAVTVLGSEAKKHMAENGERALILTAERYKLKSLTK